MCQSLPEGNRNMLAEICIGATKDHVQESAKEWSLGCVKRAPAARKGQGAGITQPRDHSLAYPCTQWCKILMQKVREFPIKTCPYLQ